MTKLTTRRWAIIFFISLALNIFLGGLIVADKYFKDRRGGFHTMTFSLGWARRVVGDEAKPKSREIFRANREDFIANRRGREVLYQNVSTALAAEPFDKEALRAALSALQVNLQSGHNLMHGMMVEFSDSITPDQRKKLTTAVNEWQKKRKARIERRRKRREEREKERAADK